MIYISPTPRDPHNGEECTGGRTPCRLRVPRPRTRVLRYSAVPLLNSLRWGGNSIGGKHGCLVGICGTHSVPPQVLTPNFR